MMYFEGIFVLQHTDKTHTGWSSLNKITIRKLFTNNMMIKKGCKMNNIIVGRN